MNNTLRILKENKQRGGLHDAHHYYAKMIHSKHTFELGGTFMNLFRDEEMEIQIKY